MLPLRIYGIAGVIRGGDEARPERRNFLQKTTGHDPRELARRSIQRYMELCDVPAVRFDRRELASLFADHAVWQGVGDDNAAKFGRVVGPRAIVEMLERYLPPHDHFRLNMHLLDRGTMVISDGKIEGDWTMMRLSTYGGGRSDLTASRLRVEFELHEGRALISLYQPLRIWQQEIGDEVVDQMFGAFSGSTQTSGDRHGMGIP
ncbi:nuclear transport factor 2 family protein [Pseudonocardia hispaniensis]|uniref:Nuclear transport factor 2 family protein n=1 Tax=Pseudonocardia hispaniensis TaxID=904933 RepID=A0ABW1IXL8_9PSEU